MNTGELMSVGAKQALVARVADSDLFQKAPRLREFFLYAAECTLENRLSEVREQVIAERVFSRRSDFQGTQDSIVRAEARNLRKRLEAYFSAEGRDEAVIVSMPKGGYALAFEPRPPEASLNAFSAGLPMSLAAPPAEISELPSSELPGDSAITVPRRFRRATLFVILVCSFIAVGALGYTLGSFQGRTQLEQRLQITQPILPFSALFGKHRQSVIVTSDTGFMQIATLAHRSLSLDDYIARSYPEVPGVMPPNLIHNWNLYEFTDGREMSIAGLILSSYPQFASHIALRSGHEATLEDLKTHTAILIGSPISNPWAQLFEDHLNFRCEFDGSGRILFRNGGQQYPNADDIEHGRTYARLAFLPGSNDTPAALLIAGTTAQSTEAAGELVADRTRFARTLRTIGIDPAGPARFFEILLRSNVFVGGSTAPETAAWQLKPVPEK